MPLLFYGPGGGGGGNGYKYRSKDVAGLSYGRNADGILTLNWSDPEDEAPASEWKGTVVVCKEGEPPKSVDDGEVVCESAVKNQYRDAGLVLDVGGPGYYYGVFPYTKDGVVNTNEANVVYILNDGYDADLKNASWADIAYISSEGGADQVWSVGDEKKLVLTGDYNGEITMQIAGFNHDDLASGGKAGITFLSKQLVVATEKMNLTATSDGGWKDTYMRNTIMPRIKGSLPQGLQNIIKKVKKISTPGGGAQSLTTVEDDLFIPSVIEVGGFDTNVCSSEKPSSSYLVSGDGSKYPVFKSKSDLVKPPIYGVGKGWWTRTTSYSTSRRTEFGAVRPDGNGFMSCEANGSSSGVNMCGVCFGFCV